MDQVVWNKELFLVQKYWLNLPLSFPNGYANSDSN
jgi:hypothetical protein